MDSKLLESQDQVNCSLYSKNLELFSDECRESIDDPFIQNHKGLILHVKKYEAGLWGFHMKKTHSLSLRLMGGIQVNKQTKT